MILLVASYCNFIVPAAIEFPKKRMGYTTELEMVRTVQNIFELQGFKAKLEVPLKRGNRMIYRADMILNREGQAIVVEVKRGDSMKKSAPH